MIWLVEDLQRAFLIDSIPMWPPLRISFLGHKFTPARMGDKKKKATVFIRLVSAAGTGFFYVKRKPTKVTEKLEFRKFDPRT
ncbi:Ribosomal protein L33 family protein [Prunus dulcis]|uniref:50S ribosomal protein L33, chloroplastic n=1 Tax=Prunus dulcis TaxID=3755 RepID=A0A4Y1QN21_PRUDU|nr:Ribosomal protein L33 family protein [Prunus dulcis]